MHHFPKTRISLILNLCFEFYALAREYIADKLEALDIYLSWDKCQLTLLSTQHSSYAIEHRLEACIERRYTFPDRGVTGCYRAARSHGSTPCHGCHGTEHRSVAYVFIVIPNGFNQNEILSELNFNLQSARYQGALAMVLMGG